LVAFFIILTAASTLYEHGITQISTSAEAATALKPLAGRFAFALFACGIVGTGLLAVPVLAASARLWHWRSGPLERKPGADAKTSGPVLRRHLHGHHPRAVTELPAHRPGEGSFLGRRSKWAGFGPPDGSNYDYRF
jgi:Mn2+/Fe2+ NRAMP family transporter